VNSQDAITQEEGETERPGKPRRREGSNERMGVRPLVGGPKISLSKAGKFAALLGIFGREKEGSERFGDKRASAHLAKGKRIKRVDPNRRPASCWEKKQCKTACPAGRRFFTGEIKEKTQKGKGGAS